MTGVLKTIGLSVDQVATAARGMVVQFSTEVCDGIRQLNLRGRMAECLPRRLAWLVNTVPLMNAADYRAFEGQVSDAFESLLDRLDIDDALIAREAELHTLGGEFLGLPPMERIAAREAAEKRILGEMTARIQVVVDTWAP